MQISNLRAGSRKPSPHQQQRYLVPLYSAGMSLADSNQLATFYFDGSPPSSYIDDVAKFDKELQKADGYLGYAVGITHETVEHEGVKGKAAVLAIGWNSVDAHMAFRETQAFKDNIGLLRSESKKVTMW
jgi:hypothetical protein